MKTGNKTLDSLPEKHRKKIESISDERNNGDGWWIYLNKEYADLNFDPQWNCRQIHEQTLAKCISRLKGSELITAENTNENPNRNTQNIESAIDFTSKFSEKEKENLPDYVRVYTDYLSVS